MIYFSTSLNKIRRIIYVFTILSENLLPINL